MGREVGVALEQGVDVVPGAGRLCQPARQHQSAALFGRGEPGDQGAATDR